ncbi:MAG: T9SS type A sorting domain-containing protein [Hymenobacter sp.]|nr:MAG: T9SS type A sorting domain-containing protein [Hymenobacter sp.]
MATIIRPIRGAYCLGHGYHTRHSTGQWGFRYSKLGYAASQVHRQWHKCHAGLDPGGRHEQRLRHWGRREQHKCVRCRQHLQQHGEYAGRAVWGTGTTPGKVSVGGASGTTSPDVLLAKYTDNGANATLSWTQVGGGTNSDYSNGVAVSGTNVLVGGYVTPSARFGSITIANPIGSSVPVLVRLVNTSLTPLPVRAEALSSELTLFPNPASGRAATICGAVPNQVVQVLDAQGRLVSTTTASVLGRAQLVVPAVLPAGLYVVRVGQQALRLSVE